MNFKKLENNLLDMIQEQQVKIGYMSGVTRFYYPLQSLNSLLGTEPVSYTHLFVVSSDTVRYTTVSIFGTFP